MLTAAEASEYSNDIEKEAELFIELVIEPEIKKVMVDESLVKIPFHEDWFHGPVYQKPEDLKLSHMFGDDMSIPLTDEINRILEVNGYRVTEEYINETTKEQNGYGYFVIEWD